MKKLVCVAALFAASMTLAQVNKSNLSGIVRDSSGAVVTGAEVKLVNIDTTVARQEVTDNSGLYRFVLVDLGNYRIEVAHAGFKRFTRSGILLNAGETTTADVTLEVGGITDSVTVQGEASVLRTETGSLGATISQRTIAELPLQGRNPYVFLSLSAGIQYTGDPGALNPWDNSGPSGFTANGSKAKSEFLLDGTPNMKLDLVGFSPSPDAVGEMRVQTNAFDAEYGHSGAGFINVSTKSGTNQVHGTGYEYLQNDKLNAATFFNNLNNQPRTIRRKNTFGGSLGGPVVLPKIYDGRNKTFFFFNYERTRNPSPGSALVTVPTLLERKGDFSKTVDAQGRPIVIYDPLTTNAAGTARTPFSGNIINPDRFDAIGAKLINALYPLPNITPTAGSINNYFNARPRDFKWNSMSSRVDENIGSNHQLFFRFGWNHRTDFGPPYFPDNILASDGADVFERGNIAAGFGDTWIKTSRTVVDFRLGLTRYFDRNYLLSEGIDLTTRGFPASYAKAVQYSLFPTMQFTDTKSVGSQTPNKAYVNQIQPSVNIHSVFSRHSIKYGFRFTAEQQNLFRTAINDANNPNSRPGGWFNFTRAFTQGPNPTQASALAGSSTAALLLGLPSAGSVSITADAANSNKYYAFYFQDDWKTTNRLTLNLGMRFEHEGGVTDRYDAGISGLDTAISSPLEAAAKANYAKNPIPELATLSVKGGLGFLNTNGAGRSHLDLPALMYAPRVGFAYRVSNFMVWRGGWGIYYVPNNMVNFNQLGFSLNTLMITSLDNNLTPFNKLANPFPNGLSQPLGSKAGLLTAVGQSLTPVTTAPIGSVPDFKDGLSQQFSTGFQFALPWNFSVETSYVGNRSQRLTINNRNINDIPNQFLSLGTRLNTRVANPFFGVITDPTSALSQSTVTVRQLLQPFPQFINITNAALPFGRSNYDSAQLQITRRLAQGVQLGVAYTFSKFMEQTSYLNSNDAKPEHVISDADFPHHLVLSGLWELPFGPGRPLFNSTNGFIKRIAGGWQISGIATFQSGQALAFSGAERVSDTNNDQHVYTNWFDKNQFIPQPAFTLRRTSSRIVDIRGPGINKVDLTVTKRILVTERVFVTIQGEFYNAFNHTNFSNPNTTVTNGSFATISGVQLQPRNIQLSGRITF
ncbi:MAG TPA: TonB-dependent receptor [Bryobacteraceae bacterium]|jgi:hypothetical protein|nr:TonB-dependent receptor [Bryobacteraceae bacterium]